MAKGILSKPRKASSALRAETKTIGGALGPISAKEIAQRTTPAQRYQWASNYMRGFTQGQMLKRKMGM